MAEQFDDLNRTGANFLLTDLDLAMTFLDVAATSRSEEVRQRNRRNARRAYDSVLALSSKLTLNEAETQTINARVLALKNRLQAMGEDVL